MERAFSYSYLRLWLFPLQHLNGRLILLTGLIAADSLWVMSIPRPVAYFRLPLHCAFVAYLVFLFLGQSVIRAQKEELPIGWGCLAAHLPCFAAPALPRLLGINISLPMDSVAARFIWTLLCAVGLILLALACVPFRRWVNLLYRGRLQALYSVLAGLASWGLHYQLTWLWGEGPGRVVQLIAFHAVAPLLRLLLPGVLFDPATLTIADSNFAVHIALACSGVEGVVLIFVFLVLWLWYFRKEYRFPHALLLIPCAFVVMWLLNVLRVVALVVIGSRISPEVALIGFHANAGWIAFTLVALGITVASRRLRWVRHVDVAGASGMPEERVAEPEGTRYYLLPFLAILAASFVSKSVSGQFEWAYPLRFAAATAVLWHYRAEAKKLNWHFGASALLVGAAVLLLWIAPEYWGGAPAATLGGALAALPPLGRWLWTGFRVAAAVLTVPVAEELAFRGYLPRRLMSRQFTGVAFTQLAPWPVLISSLAFGAMHGRHWIAGSVAGAAFAIQLRHKGRIGDAVAAHATSNLLLAAWVLLRGDWGQW
jgi:exosortase E/protease (VPEID-CTERM system)